MEITAREQPSIKSGLVRDLSMDARPVRIGSMRDTGRVPTGDRPLCG